MSQEHRDSEIGDRPALPIERGFPIERVNEIVEKESMAKQYYRPIYTMHKWWARRPGALFRAISLYSLLDENTTADDVEVYEPGENHTLGDEGLSEQDLVDAISEISMDDPESLWEFYPKDVRIKDKKILDPFMGGGTTLVEASRFGVESVGIDLNPVAWFVTKKQLDAGQTNVEELERAFEQVKEDVADEILQYYRTPCPNGDHEADVMYNFWVKELDCASCEHTVPLFSDHRIASGRYGNNKNKDYVVCPKCDKIQLTEHWKSETECECDNKWIPQDGNTSRGGYYNCPKCGQKESIVDAISKQGKPDTRLYSIEYYCRQCATEGEKKEVYKGYKSPSPSDIKLFEEARKKWQSRTDLHEYVPDEVIPKGAITAASEVSGNDVFQHGYKKWTDMFNQRQLLGLSLLLKSISKIDDENIREFLLLTFSESLNYNTIMNIYNPNYNKNTNIFKNNSFSPPYEPIENNIWGTEDGTGTFCSMYDMVKKGIKYANSPTDRHIENGETKETPEFAQPIGQNIEVYQDDMRNITAENEYDAVITDPPYYDNIIYSEVADYFYVWQKILLEDEYPGFDRDKTPRAESIVTNPYLDKTAEDFEHEMGEALSVIRRAVKDDGTLAFTYHHSDKESWGELLESLCENGFEVTATYPINSDMNKFIGGEAVSFDIVIVARPTDERRPISWNSLRRRIVRTAQDTHETLEKSRDLKSGDIGVIEMGKCFQEYSKHHGEVRRGGEIMEAKEVVEEIYDILDRGDLGEADIYLELLEAHQPRYDDLNKLLRRSDVSEEALREMKLFRTSADDFELLDWRDEQRQAYVQNKVQNGNGDVTELDRAHFLRYRYEHDQSTKEYLERWETDDLKELCEGLAEATGDEIYLRMVGVDTSLAEFTDE